MTTLCRITIDGEVVFTMDTAGNQTYAPGWDSASVLAVVEASDDIALRDFKEDSAPSD